MIDLSALPNTPTPVGASSQTSHIAEALRHALGDNPRFEYYVPIRGAPRSGRLFSVRPEPSGASIALSMTAEHTARELVRYTEAARYEPTNPINRDTRKGWEIRSLTIDGAPAAIAWATWTAD